MPPPRRTTQSGLEALESRWLFQVEPYPNEAILSYLNRVSFRSQIPLSDIQTALSGKKSNLTADWDVILPATVKAQIGLRFGLSPEGIDAMSVERFIPVLRPSTEKPQKVPWANSARTHIAWVLPVTRMLLQPQQAIRGRGTPYCFFCFEEEGPFWYNQLTRFSFVTFCPSHDEPLMERCPRCGNGASPLSLTPRYTWSKASGSRFCRNCHRDPIVEDKHEHDTPTPTERVKRLRALQHRSLLALSNGSIDIPEIGAVSARGFFIGLRRILTHAYIPFHHLPIPLRGSVDLSGSYHPSMAFEYLPLWERNARLGTAAWVLEDPFERWQKLRKLGAVDRHVPREVKHPWHRVDET